MRPSTLYYKLVHLIYRHGFRPKPSSLFYSKPLENEARWMGQVW